MFLVNTAEHINRPCDMLMFLGEYFKEVIVQTEKIANNIRKKSSTLSHQQEYYYITSEIMNSLGLACKKYIEAPRQQLRISIALARNPEFENKE